MPFEPQNFGQPIVLTLRRNADTRYAHVMREIDGCADWPFQRPRPFYGVDGRVDGVFPPPHVANPVNQTLSRGGWGCQLSYVNLMYEFLERGDDWLFILEDDLWLVDGFAEKVVDYLAHVPDDADCVYVGGMPHAKKQFPPVFINKRVCRPWRVTATHFCMFHRRFVRTIWRWLLSIPTTQMDAMFARFHSMPATDGNPAHGGRFNVYFPLGDVDENLVVTKPLDLAGQVMGQSDIQSPGTDAPELTRMIWNVRSRIQLKPYGSDVTARIGGPLYESEPAPFAEAI